MTSEEYIKMQKMWLKATGVKEDSWVKVTRAAESHESGWNNLWMPEMDEFVGKVLRVEGPWNRVGIKLNVDNSSYYSFPFFILEPAEAPKPEKYQFKPFEQVLVRDEDSQLWYANLFGGTGDDGEGPFECVSLGWPRTPTRHDGRAGGLGEVL